MLGLSQQALLDKAKHDAEGDDRVPVQLMFGGVEWILSGKNLVLIVARLELAFT
jgi:hypothetical protein